MPAKKGEGLEDLPAARQTQNLLLWSQTAREWVPRNTIRLMEKGPENGDGTLGGRQCGR